MADENDIGGRVGLDITDFKAGIADLNRQIKVIDSGFKAAAAGMDDWGSSEEGLQARIQALNQITDLQRQKVANLTEQYALVAAEKGANSRAAQDLQVRINNETAALNRNALELGRVTSGLEELGAGAGDTSGDLEEMNEASEEVVDHLKEIGGSVVTAAAVGIAAIGAAAIGAIGGLLSFADSTDQTMGKFQAQTGASTEEMEQFRDVAMDIYRSNFGDGVADIADSMAMVKQVTGETGLALEGTTKNALILRDVFAFEVSDSVNTANSLMKQFGITSDQAYALIAQGAQNGANKNGDLLDVLSEYATQFATLGFSSEEFTDVLIQGAKDGAFEVDKVGDAIKEFTIRSKDGSKSSQQAFEALGLDANKMFQSFATGGKTAQAAFKETLSAVNNIQDPLKQNTVGVQLFGTQWEDLQGKAITSLVNIKSTTDSTADTLATLNDVNYNGIGSALEGLKRQLISSIAKPIGDTILPKIRQMIDSLSSAITIFSGTNKKITDTEKMGAQERIKSLETEKNARIATLKESVTAKKSFVAESVAATGDEVGAEKDALNDRKDMLNERKDLAVEGLDKELEVEKDKLEAYKETSSEAISLRKDQLDAATGAIDEELKALDAAEKVKLKSLDTEYIARLKLIDSDAAARLEQLNAQKDMIEHVDEVAKAAEKQRKEQEKIADLQAKINSADTTDNRKSAEKDLADYLKELDVARQEEIRKSQVDGIEDQIKSVEADQKFKETALKEEIKGREDAEKDSNDVKAEQFKTDKEKLQEAFETFKTQEENKVKESQKTFDAYKKQYDADKKALEDNLKATTKTIDSQLKALDKIKSAGSGGGGSVADPEPIAVLPNVNQQIADITEQYDKMIKEQTDTAEDAEPVLSGTFVGVIKSLKWIVDNASIIAAAAVGIGVGMATWNVVGMVQGLITAIKAWRAATTGLTTAQALLNLVMVANPIGVVITVVAALVAAFIVLWKTNDGFRDAMVNAWDAIVKTFMTVLDWVKDNWKTLLLFLVNPIGGALKLLYDMNPRFREWVDKVWDTIIDTFKNLPKTIKTFFTNIIDDIKQWGVDVLNWVKTGVPEIIQKVIEFFDGLPVKIGVALGFALGTLIKWGIDAVKWAIDAVPKIIGKILEFFNELPAKTGTAFTGAFTSIKTWGANVLTWIKTEVPKLIGSVVGFFGDLPAKIAEKLAGVIGVINTWAGDVTESAKTEVPKIISKIIEFFADLPKLMIDIGKDMVKGLWDGITAMASWLKDKVKGFAGGVVDGIKGALDINSPSGVMRDEVGMMMGAGMAEGIAASAKQVNAAMQQLNGDVVGQSHSDALNRANNQSVATGSAPINYNYNNEGLMSGASFVVRNDSDILAIAKEIFKLQRTEETGLGYAT